VPAADGLRQLAGQEPGNRDRAGLVRLGGAEDHLSAHVREGPPDVDPAPGQVDIADPQGSCLAPAQAPV
jgi:hypothetical protein